MERLTVAKEGFYGLFHPAAEPADEKLAVIVLGGSEGNENIPMNVGRMFAERGITALGVCVWNVEGLSAEFLRVPLDPFEKAIAWLEARGFSEIYLYGISEGAKTALLTASLMPRIKGVVALSPIHCVWNGKHGNKGLFGKTFADAPEYTYRGKDLPYMKVQLTYGRAILNLLFHRQVEISYIYERPLEHFDERAAIQVENIQGDILFIHAAEDTMWPSGKAVSYMLNRLRQKGFTHHAGRLVYAKASHILVPLNPKQLRFFRIERKFPEECRRSREDAFEKTIAWLLSKPSDRLNSL